MLENKIHWDIQEYENVRSYLLINSAGFKKMIGGFKKKYKLSKLSSKEAKNVLGMDSFVPSQMYKELTLLAERLRINNVLMEDIISGYIKYKGLDFRSLPFYASSADEPLSTGFYIKISPYTRFTTVKRTYEYIMDLHEKNLKEADEVEFKNKTISKRGREMENLNDKIKLYLLIEKTIFKRLKEAKDISGLMNTDKLIKDSIEFASEEIYKEIKFDYCKDIYYKLLTYYEIPSFQEFQKLPIRPYL